MPRASVIKVKVGRGGKPYTFKELSDKHNIPQSVLRMRYYNGIRGHRLIEPVRTRNQKVKFKALHGTVGELASQLGVDYSSMATAVRIYNLA